MTRLFTMAKSQLRGRSFAEMMVLAKTSLFRDEPILVYSLKVSEVKGEKEGESKEPEVRKGDVLELERLQGLFRPVPWEFQCYRYDGVRDFFIAQNRDGIQHISWVYYEESPNRILRLGTQEAEIKYSLTLPPFRGRGVYPRVLKNIVRFLGQRGFNRAFICVREDNQPSIRAIEKAGFKSVGRVHLRKMMGVQVSKRFDTKEV